MKAIKGGKFTYASVYLKGKAWEKLGDPKEAEAKSARGIAKVGGKLWMGTRLAALSRKPTGHIVVTTFDEREIAAGRTTREAVVQSKRLEHGWPLVNRMRDLARWGDPFITSQGLLPFVEDFREVHRDSDLFSAWRALHERRGLPFMERAPEWVYFPPVDPDAGDLDRAVEAALTAFLSTIGEVGDDDAA